jgi:class 3 adenylate cyclase
MVDRGDHRIGDGERQQAIDLLRSHTGAGRLTLDEFSDLAGQVFAAQTYRELDAVGRQLPPGLVPEPPAGTPQPGSPASFVGDGTPGVGAPAASAPAPRRRTRRRFVAVMSGSRARGRWRAAPEITAFALWGGVRIDLREAEIEGAAVDIVAWAVMGGVTVIVPPGIRVELDGMVLMGGSSDFTRATELVEGAPLVRVHARGLWGGVTVLSRKPRGSSRGGPDDTGAGPGARDDDPEASGDGAGVRPRHHDDPLELPSRVLDDLAAWLPPPSSPAGVPRRDGRSSRSSRPPGRPRGGRRSRYDGERAEGAPAAPEAPPSGTLTMMVTDIVASTRLAERLGDRRWIEVLAAHNALVREQVGRHGGTEIKAQGDGFLVVFPSARRAILAAVEVQRALARYGDDHPDTAVALRIGLHTGEIVDVDGDVLGQNVVVAARIADEAAPGEVVVSALTRDLTVSGGDLAFGPADEVELKGLSQPWRIHRVTWSHEPA